MKELYFFDETFYWGRSGKRATVIEAECELTQSVRPTPTADITTSTRSLWVAYLVNVTAQYYKDNEL